MFPFPGIRRDPGPPCAWVCRFLEPRKTLPEAFGREAKRTSPEMMGSPLASLLTPTPKRKKGAPPEKASRASLSDSAQNQTGPPKNGQTHAAPGKKEEQQRSHPLGFFFRKSSSCFRRLENHKKKQSSREIASLLSQQGKHIVISANGRNQCSSCPPSPASLPPAPRNAF